MNPLQRYQSDIDSGAITEDPAQRVVIQHLQRLYDELLACQAQSRSWQSRLRRRLTGVWSARLPVPKGIYLWGGVGRGKTYLMDLLCDGLPPEMYLRTHFHRFMQEVHSQLRGLQGVANPLERVADNLVAKYKLLCFDEFFVMEIGDAMILAGLLDAMFKRDIVLVTTSNIDPDGLYDNGLQRTRFLPAIALLKTHLEVVHIDAGADYRLRTLSQATLYYHPSNADTQLRLHDSFRQLAPDTANVQENCDIEILNRGLRARLCADDVVWFEFAQLCDGPRSAYDYVEVAKLFHALILSDVPQMSDATRDQVRRFINLVDELYDRRVKLIIAASVPIESLYTGSQLAFEFERTRSRLIEMQSYEYLGCEHRG